MQKKASDKHFVKKPTYIGGLKAMREFIVKEMKYPKAALENKIEGSVFIKYEVDHKGKVVSSRILSKLGYGCDEEAQRIVSKLTFYVGKNPRKMRIKFNKSIRIKFRLPKNKVVKTKPKSVIKTQSKPKKIDRFVYTVTSAPSKVEKKQGSKSNGYSYTIKY